MKKVKGIKFVGQIKEIQSKELMYLPLPFLILYAKSFPGEDTTREEYIWRNQ